MPTTKEDMRTPLLLAVCFGLLTLAAAAEAAKPVRRIAPANLHGFLLALTSLPARPSRAPPRSRGTRFRRGPLQFQLATLDLSREGCVSPHRLADDSSRSTHRDAAVDHGQPARALRASPWRTASGTTPWSRAFGFDMTPGPPPKPLPAAPGLLRWTPVEEPTATRSGSSCSTTRRRKWRQFFTNVLDESANLHLPSHSGLEQIPCAGESARSPPKATHDNKQTRQNGLPAVG